MNTFHKLIAELRKSLDLTEEALRKSNSRIAQLEAVIAPFAEDAGQFTEEAKDTDLVWVGIEGDGDCGNATGNVCVRDYRAAHRAMLRKGNEMTMNTTTISKYGVWCIVWAGATGHREAWLKKDGVVAEFENLGDAHAEASRLNLLMADNRNASFSYTAKPLGSDR